MTATPWGDAEPVESIRVPQRVGERRFETRIELLETRSGERLLRVAYATDDRVRRGPVTLRVRDLVKLRRALERAPALRDALAGSTPSG